MIHELTVKTNRREELIDITSHIQKLVSESEIPDGIVTCFVPHTTAAITINENADPDVRRDIIYKLGKEIPQHDSYHHAEGNSDAHLKSSLIGPSLQILFDKNRLVLGRWQGILFCEFDGPRTRRLIVKVIGLA
ncbi:MAG: YjbQ family protein [Candidatus Zixiibacteriota bacterium]|nr:MAG: YjbQ family protein [candidate division Zixibacteria bacterium]